jgi:hypothetical protein
VHQLETIERIAQRFPIRGNGPRIDLLAHLSVLAKSPDTALRRDATADFDLIGEHNLTGMWKAKPDPPRLAPADLQARINEVIAAHQRERARGHYRLPRPAHQKLMLKQLRQEQERGWWEHP